MMAMEEAIRWTVKELHSRVMDEASEIKRNSRYNVTNDPDAFVDLVSDVLDSLCVKKEYQATVVKGMIKIWPWAENELLELAKERVE